MHSQLFAAIARNSFCSHLLWEQKRGIPLWKKCNISAIFQQLYHRKNLFVNRCNCTKYAFQFVQINNSPFSALQSPIHGKNTLPIRVFLPSRNRNFRPEVKRRGDASPFYATCVRNFSAIILIYLHVIFKSFSILFVISALCTIRLCCFCSLSTHFTALWLRFRKTVQFPLTEATAEDKI